MVKFVPLHQPNTAAEIRADFESIGSASVEVAALKVLRLAGDALLDRLHATWAGA